MFEHIRAYGTRRRSANCAKQPTTGFLGRKSSDATTNDSSAETSLAIALLGTWSRAKRELLRECDILIPVLVILGLAIEIGGWTAVSIVALERRSLAQLLLSGG